jgi:16S rRNA (guanine527-N7)-methyltransferase
MNFSNFKKQINLYFHKIDNNFFDNIQKYKLFLQENNISKNLSRICCNEKIYSLYFFDSIIPYKNIDLTNCSILDVGSGSGIPGIILKLLYPSIKLTIIESNNKKCDFMNNLAKKLNIDITIINKRAEEIKKNEYEKFDIVTSRAVAPLKIILEISIPYAKINGMIIEPKSKNYLQENENLNLFLKKMGCILIKIENFISPSGFTHNIFFVKKIFKTSRQYPRK